MRKTITISLFALIAICSAPSAFGQQDTSMARHPKNYSDDEDNEDAAPQPAAKKKQTYNEPSFSFGVAGGLNEAAFIIGGSTGGARNGLVLGGVIDQRLGGVVHLESGLYYAATGGTGIILNNGDIADWDINTFEVPVILQFKFGKPGRNHFFIGLGGYVAYNVSGTSSTEDGYNGAINIGTDNNSQLKSTDVGIIFNVGYQLKDGLFFRINGQGGISNQEPDNFVTVRTTSSCYEVGYFFDAKPKHTTKRHVDHDVEMQM